MRPCTHEWVSKNKIFLPLWLRKHTLVHNKKALSFIVVITTNVFEILNGSFYFVVPLKLSILHSLVFFPLYHNQPSEESSYSINHSPGIHLSLQNDILVLRYVKVWLFPDILLSNIQLDSIKGINFHVNLLIQCFKNV